MPTKSDHSSSSLTKSQLTFSMSNDDDDDGDDFQNPTHSLPLTQTKPVLTNNSSSSKLALKPSNRTLLRPSKKPKPSLNHSPGKENIPPPPPLLTNGTELDEDYAYCSLDAIPSSFDDDCGGTTGGDIFISRDIGVEKKKGLKLNESSYLSNSMESRLLNSRLDCNLNEGTFEDFEPGSQIDLLLKLCTENELYGDGLVHCPLCGTDISDLKEESRQVHTNNCLDQGETPNAVMPSDDPGLQISRPVVSSSPPRLPGEVVDLSPVLDWLCNLGLGKYEEAFIREEIDWDTLQWLSEEDLISIGVTALGPRKKIVHALNDLRRGTPHVAQIHENVHANTDPRKKSTNEEEMHPNTSNVVADDTGKSVSNKLITDFFPGSVTDKNNGLTSSKPKRVPEEGPSETSRKRGVKKPATNGKVRDVPLWCCIPGTPFRVDAFRFLRRDCSHWFLTHFHIDHYQGLTKSFCHGTIYCSLITAKLVNMKIGIPWDKLQVLPLNQKISIAGSNVTCLDANHCPGSIIILFEPPNGKAILHTGDFRFSETMTSLSALESHPIHTLILDTTYCKPQYDFPKQDAVIQFVIETIQAEAFNPKTLFLIGSYTIGKERLFLDVARVLRKKVYVNASKLRLLKCLGFPEEDMQWFTVNEHESHIHVVPMWTLASFKRLKHISNQYAGRFNLIVAFSPTGWTFGKGKKKSTGRRWQQGTLIRYEVPYSEHSSFTELREFVKFVSPSNIIPSVNNDGPESANNMVALLLS